MQKSTKSVIDLSNNVLPLIQAFGKILNKDDQVSAFAIFIGSLGDQADRLAKTLPSGKAFVCLDTKKIPEILKTIFASTMLR